MPACNGMAQRLPKTGEVIFNTAMMMPRPIFSSSDVCACIPSPQIHLWNHRIGNHRIVHRTYQIMQD